MFRDVIYALIEIIQVLMAWSKPAFLVIQVPGSSCATADLCSEIFTGLMLMYVYQVGFQIVSP
jgi:hypothetical protein